MVGEMEKIVKDKQIKRNAKNAEARKKADAVKSKEIKLANIKQFTEDVKANGFDVGNKIDIWLNSEIVTIEFIRNDEDEKTQLKFQTLNTPEKCYKSNDIDDIVKRQLKALKKKEELFNKALKKKEEAVFEQLMQNTKKIPGVDFVSDVSEAPLTEDKNTNPGNQKVDASKKSDNCKETTCDEGSITKKQLKDVFKRYEDLYGENISDIEVYNLMLKKIETAKPI